MAGTLSEPRIAALTSTSFEFYVTDSMGDYGIVAILTTDEGVPSPEQMYLGQDATGTEVPAVALVEPSIGENLIGMFSDLDFSGGKTYYLWAVGFSYEEEGAVPTNLLGPIEVRPLVDKVWKQGKDATGNRRTYSVLVDRSLAGAVTALAHAGGALTTTVGPAAGNARIIATATGALTAAIRLAGGGVAQAHAASALVSAIQLAAGPQERHWLQGKDPAGNRRTYSTLVHRIGAKAASVASGALSTSPRMAGAAVDVVSSTARLINWQTVTLVAPLYTGPGSLLDARFWEGAPPKAGDRVAYDSTYLNVLSSGEMEWTSNNATALVQYNDGTGWMLGSVTVLPTAIVAFAGARATASGALAGGSAASLIAHALVVASAAATLTASILFSGSAAGRTQAIAALSALIKLQADAAARATASGALDAVPSLVGSARSEAAAAADLRSQILMAGNAVVNAAAGGDLFSGLLLAGHAASTTLSTGALDVGIGLAGDAEAIAHAEADLMAQIQLVATAAVTAAASGQMTALGPVVVAPRGEPNYGRSRRPRVLS